MWVGGCIVLSVIVVYMTLSGSQCTALSAGCMLLNTYITECYMHCMHECIWRYERISVVCKFLCFVHTFSLILSCLIYVYK